MISFVLKGGLDESRRFVSTCQLFTLAESLGGVESLIRRRALSTIRATIGRCRCRATIWIDGSLAPRPRASSSGARPSRSPSSAETSWPVDEPMPDLDLTDPIALLLASHDAFATAGLAAATYGGLALAAYGVPRETRDADLAIAGFALTLAVDAFRAAGLNVNPAFENVRFGGNLVSRLAVTGGGELNTVDLVTPRSDRLAKVILDRALVGSLRGRELRVVSPEDFVLLKLLSTRARDLEDARTVAEALAADLDRELIEREVARLRDEVSEFDIGVRAAVIFDG